MKNILSRIATVSPAEAELENKALKESIGVVLAQKKSVWRHFSELQKTVQQEKQITVKEFVRELKKKIFYIPTLAGCGFVLVSDMDDLLKEYLEK